MKTLSPLSFPANIAAAFLATGIFLTAFPVQADDLIQTFTGAPAGELDGTPFAKTNSRWATGDAQSPPQAAAGAFNTNGTTNFAGNVTAHFPSVNLADAPRGVYTVTLNFTVNAASDSWIGLGFDDEQGNFLTSTDNVGPSIIGRVSSLGASAFPGPGTSVAPFANIQMDAPGKHSMSLSINTAANDWTVAASFDGKPAGSYPYAGNGGLDRVRSIAIFGFAGGGGAYTINSLVTNAAATGRTATGAVPPRTSVTKVAATGSAPAPLPGYPALRMNPQDQGIVLRYGDGPGQCDLLGARDVVVWQDQNTYYMNYDGAGSTGWLVCAATSPDGVHWEKHGAVIDLGQPGSGDSATASYGVPYKDGEKWRLYYLGSDVASPAPDLVPVGPYHSFEAESSSPLGPWKKRYDLRPFTQPAAGAGVNSSPGSVVKVGGEYLMFYTGLGIARTHDLDKPWVTDPRPLFAHDQVCENASVYYEPANQTWFLFTNRINIVTPTAPYTDSVWVFWTKDINHWDENNKAIVLDGSNCTWSKTLIGLPSVMKVGNRLGVYYDGREDPKDHWHTKRHIGLAWLDLPLQVPHP